MVNQHNCGYWPLENTRKRLERHCKPQRRAVGKNIFTNNIRLKNKNGNIITVNTGNYIGMMNNVILPELQWKRMEIRNGPLHDVLTAQIVRAKMDFPPPFGNRLNSWYLLIFFCHISPLIIFTWDALVQGTLVVRIYVNIPLILCDFKEAIRMAAVQTER